MPTSLVFETHALTEDNERGFATGWLPGKLSAKGREGAVALGYRRRNDGLQAVFSSDLGRAVETVQIAFDGSAIPIFFDWRLRECDYGELNGQPAADLRRDRLQHLDLPYPGGESWREAIARVGRFLPDLGTRWQGARLLVIGHAATRWAFDHLLNGQPLQTLLTPEFDWRPGWEYQLP